MFNENTRSIQIKTNHKDTKHQIVRRRYSLYRSFTTRLHQTSKTQKITKPFIISYFKKSPTIWDVQLVLCVNRGTVSAVLPSARGCRGLGEWRLGWLRLARTSARCARAPAAPLRSRTGTASRPPWQTKPSKPSTPTAHLHRHDCVLNRTKETTVIFSAFAWRPQPGGFKFLSASTRERSLSRSEKLNTGPHHCERETGIPPPRAERSVRVKTAAGRFLRPPDSMEEPPLPYYTPVS